MTSCPTHPAVLSQLAYPFLSLQHPSPDSFDQATVEWVRHFGLVDEERIDRFERIGCGTAARFGFHSASPQLVQIAADTMAWLFLFEDAYVTGRHRFDEATFLVASERYATFLENHPRAQPFSPFSHALGELFTRIKAVASSDWCRRFIESFRVYAWGCAREAQWRKTRTVPSFAQFLHLRRASGGYAPVADLFECIFGASLTGAERQSSEVEALRQLGADIAACVDDLYSYEKESVFGDALNMVRIVERTEGLNPDDACRFIGAFHNDSLAKLLLLESQLHAKNAPLGIRSLARAIREWSQGHHDWAVRCQRAESRLTMEFDVFTTTAPLTDGGHPFTVP